MAASMREVVEEINACYYVSAKLRERLAALSKDAVILMTRAHAYLGKDSEYLARFRAVQSKKFEWSEQSVREAQNMISEIREAVDRTAGLIDEYDRHRENQFRRLGADL